MKARFVGGNRLSLLQNGAEYFPALIEALDDAREEIYLETYIFEPDATGLAVAQALSRAVLRGVTVRVIVDGFGSARFTRQLLPQLVELGISVLVYRPERLLSRLHVRRLRRLHRKLVVIDGRTAFVGGINITEDIAAPDLAAPRFDFAVRIEGPLLQAVHAAARRLWEIVAWASFKRRLAVNVPRWRGDHQAGSVRAAFVLRDNIRHRRDIETAYLDAIRNAREEVLIANAYFLPGRSFRQALIDAAARGVKVTVLLQGRVEYRLQHYATQALFDALLKRGVRLVEYMDSFLHAKVAVIDRHWATVGSSNIDPFSLLLAREANVVVRDRDFAAQLHARLTYAIDTSSREVKPEHWARRPIGARLANRLAYGLLRFLIGVVGLRGEH